MRIRAPLKVSESASTGAAELSFEVDFQACNDRSCLAPETLAFSIPVEVDPGAPAIEVRDRSVLELSEEVRPDKTPRSPRAGPDGSEQSAEPVEKSFWAMLRDFDADAFIGRYGYVLAFIGVYLLGVGLTLTPCLYPVIPITVGFFGTQSAGKLRRQVGLALLFAAIRHLEFF